MKIRILAFATARDALGTGELELEVEASTDVAALRELLAVLYPDLVSLLPRLAIAVDGALASPKTPLSPGVEVALLPPVSGGAPEPRGRICHEPISVERVSAALANPQHGALVVFVGAVRDHHRGRAVEKIDYHGYQRMAEEVLERIAGDLEEEHTGTQVRIVHRLGELAAGEASIVIATSSPHRESAYETNRIALERVKREAPIWKREIYRDGGVVWREEESLVRGRG